MSRTMGRFQAAAAAMIMIQAPMMVLRSASVWAGTEMGLRKSFGVRSARATRLVSGINMVDWKRVVVSECFVDYSCSC